MSQAKDITGQRFGELTVLRLHHKKPRYKKNGAIHSYRLYYECKCDCGNMCIVNSDELLHGKTKSCGCYRREKARNDFSIHNLTNTRLYNTWTHMKGRCLNPTDAAYKNYGGRGITVCQEWQDDFINFYNWAMANGYTKKLTIDRININGNYEPKNCRWVDMKTQGRNKRTNVTLPYNGETHCLKEWAEIVNIKVGTLQNRVYKQWSVKDILTQPVKSPAIKNITYKNETHNIAEWARIYNQNPKLVQKRLRANWDFEKSLLTPVRSKS